MNSRPVLVVIISTLAACAAMIIAWPDTDSPTKQERRATAPPSHTPRGSAALGEAVIARIVTQRGGWGGVAVTGEKQRAPLVCFAMSQAEWDALTPHERESVAAAVENAAEGRPWRVFRGGEIAHESPVTLSGLMRKY